MKAIDTKTSNRAHAVYFGDLAKMQITPAALDAGKEGMIADVYEHAVKAAHFAGRYLDHDVPTRVRLVRDEDAHDPREDDNLGIMYCEHRRYRLGDPKASDPRELDQADVVVALPLRLYDHGGITMSVGSGAHPFDPGGWDSGQVGVIYTTRERVKAVMGWDRITTARLNQIRASLIAEVELYDQFLTGDVYGFVVENADGESLDSCWGFYGTDWKTNGMAEHWDAATLAVVERDGMKD